MVLKILFLFLIAMSFVDVFGANVSCWMRAECGQNSGRNTPWRESHLAARIWIMYEIIEISQPAPSSARIRIMNCPIGAVHSDKEFMYMCVHVFKIASCSIMGVQKSIMPQFTKKPRHYGFQKSHNATVCKPWHYGSHEIHNATVSTLIMPRFAGILWKNCPTLKRNKIFKTV